MNARCFIILLHSRTFVRTKSDLVIIFLKLLFVKKIQLFIDNMHPVYVHSIIAGVDVDVEICVNVHSRWILRDICFVYLTIFEESIGKVMKHMAKNGHLNNS